LNLTIARAVPPHFVENIFMTEKQDVLLARQPIYNDKQEVVAYELLFRENSDVVLAEFDGNRATSRVLLSLFTDSDLSTITEEKPAYINFTTELLLNPPILSPQAVVIEILEDIEITSAIIEKVKYLKRKGFTIALDDFVMDSKYEPLLKLVDIIKLELPAMGTAELEKTVAKLRKYDLKLLAEKIETPQQFKQCLDLGCHLFQGYFLSKPEIIKGKKISANKLAIVNLISSIQDPDVSMNQLTEIISRDPALSFKILKLINSAAFRRQKSIDSIHKAVTLLGIEKIKSWASLLALSKLDDKPEALHYLALVRALVCERLAQLIQPESSDQFYTVGLLSCMDAFLDQSLEDVISNISLHPIITDALLGNGGLAGLALETAIHFEQSNWHLLDLPQLGKLGLDIKLIHEIFFDCSRLAIQVSPRTD